MRDVSLRSLTPLKRLDYAIFGGFRGKSRDCLKDHAGTSDRLLSDRCGCVFLKDTGNLGRTASRFPWDNRNTPNGGNDSGMTGGILQRRDSVPDAGLSQDFRQRGGKGHGSGQPQDGQQDLTVKEAEAKRKSRDGLPRPIEEESEKEDLSDLADRDHSKNTRK